MIAAAAPRAFVDFHNHVLAGVDDGARSEAESRAALQAFFDAGAEAVIATPHFDASLVDQPERFAERMAALDRAWNALHGWAEDALPKLRLARGVELKLDVPEPDCTDERVRLAGGRFVLVEYAAMTVPIQSERPLRSIVAQGYVPVLAHPERYVGFDTELVRAREWKHAGALLQINAGSLTGRYGERARTNAMLLLGAGLADYLCSDYHARGDITTPAVLDAGTDEAEAFALLSRHNPRRLIEDEAPLAVPALQRRSWWHSVARALGMKSA